MGGCHQVKPGKCFRLFTKWSYEHELDDDNVAGWRYVEMRQLGWVWLWVINGYYTLVGESWLLMVIKQYTMVIYGYKLVIYG